MAHFVSDAHLWDTWRLTLNGPCFGGNGECMGKAMRIAVAGCVAGAAAGTAAWVWRRFGPATYARYRTMFGRARVYQVEDDDGSAVRLLEVGKIVQSGMYADERYDQLVFEYLKKYDTLFQINPDARRICVLGCGGYDYPKHLLAHWRQTQIDAVEIDPAITAIARRHFHLDRALAEHDPEGVRMRFICDDARDFLLKTDKRYDAIVNDAFDAGQPPAHLTTVAFARFVHQHLAPGGVYLTNIVAALEGPHSAFLAEQVATLESEFAHVQVIACDTDTLTVPDNVIVIATDAAAASRSV